MDSVKSLAVISVLEQVQHHHMIHALQGLLPPLINAYKLKQVLDVNCHVGSWAIDLALAYPGVTVTGLDRDPEAITLARESADAGNLKNIRFYEADLHPPLNFKDETFDFVRLFANQPLFRPDDWVPFLQECRRVMKPGASINLIYKVFGPGSSYAYQSFVVLLDQLFRAMGHGFSDKPGTSTAGVYFCRLLKQAGFTDSSYRIHPVSLGGWNNPGGRACSQLLLRGVLEAKDLFLQHNVVSREEFDTLIDQTEKDMADVEFCATAALISTFATKR